MSQPFESIPDPHNPFSVLPESQSGATERPPAKPSMATAFGILNLVFGGMSLLSQGAGLIMIFFLRTTFEEISKQPIPFPGALQWAGTGIQLLLTFWLIYSGVRVLSGTLAGRRAFIVYCLGSLLIRPFLVAINVFAQYDQLHSQVMAGGPQLPAGAMIGIVVATGLFSLVLVEVYEVVGFFVMRSKNVTQQFRVWDAVASGKRSNETFNFNSHM